MATTDFSEVRGMVVNAIITLHSEGKGLYDQGRNTQEKGRRLLDIAAAYAHAIHLHLEHEGNAPEYPQSFVQKRGCQPSDPEFYRQFHAIEEFLKRV